MPETSVALAYLHPGMVAHSFMASVIQTRTLHPSVPIWPVRSGPLMIPESRNHLVDQLLHSEIDWLWFVDSDVGFAADTLQRLLRVADPVERPVVSGLVYGLIDDEPDAMGGNRQSMFPMMFEFTGDEMVRSATEVPPDQLVQVDAAGAGMLLIHRSVLEKIDDPFTRIGALGEDLSFGRRLKDLGIPMYVHTGIRTTHYKMTYFG